MSKLVLLDGGNQKEEDPDVIFVQGQKAHMFSVEQILATEGNRAIVLVGGRLLLLDFFIHQKPCPVPKNIPKAFQLPIFDEHHRTFQFRPSSISLNPLDRVLPVPVLVVDATDFQEAWIIENPIEKPADIQPA